jgi:hypothetical protein
MINVILASALVGAEWSASCSCRFTPRERVPSNHRLSGSQSQSGRYGEAKNVYPTGTRNPTPRPSGPSSPIPTTLPMITSISNIKDSEYLPDIETFHKYTELKSRRPLTTNKTRILRATSLDLSGHYQDIIHLLHQNYSYPVWRRVRILPPWSLRVVRGDRKGTQ